MITGIRLRNVRSLGDTGRIEFKPITLLLGQNSSGKSTLLRSLPLLRQSVRTRSNSPILWYGDFVDFGSFQEVKSSFSGNGLVGFSLFMENVPLTSLYYQTPYRDRSTIGNVELGIELGEVDGATRLRSFYIRVEGDEVAIAVDNKGQISSLTVNGVDFARIVPRDRIAVTLTEIVPQLFLQGEKARTPYPGYTRANSLTEHEIFALFTKIFDKRVSVGTIRTLARRLEYKSAPEFRQKLESLNVNLKSWESVKSVILYADGVYGIDHLRALYLIGILPDLLYSISQQVSYSFRDLAYVGPSRATGERYYRHQELAIDQIDPQGQNLAMYLYSLSSQQRDQFSNWLEEEIGYALRVGRQGGHIQIELRERGGALFHNLADMGYGFSQILPVMAQIWGKEVRRSSAPGSSSPFIAIEQPELHLHPAYQARIADVMASSVARRAPRRARASFVVETHSEALVNRLGEIIYDGKLSPDDVAIYLFHRLAATDATEITRSTYDESGNLVDWPIGFFSSRARL